MVKCPGCGEVFKSSGSYGIHCRYSACHGGTVEQKFWANVAKSDGCWIYTKSAKPDGYRFFRYWVQGESRQQQWYAHRYSWFLANGELPTGMEVAHRCDNRGCVRPDHLFLATHHENMLDMQAKGRQATGPSAKAKLTEAQAIEIIKLRGIESAAALSERFGIAPGSICAIWSGRSWKNLERPPQFCSTNRS
jgi:hypothetical protein